MLEPLEAFAYVGGEWKTAPRMPASAPVDVRLLTYNVWFGAHMFEERRAALMASHPFHTPSRTTHPLRLTRLPPPGTPRDGCTLELTRKTGSMHKSVLRNVLPPVGVKCMPH